jgi:hypothetical protein
VLINNTNQPTNKLLLKVDGVGLIVALALAIMTRKNKESLFVFSLIAIVLSLAGVYLLLTR